MQQENLNYSIPFSTKRWFLFGLTSVFFHMSFVLMLFAPYPVALAGILYGRKKGYLLVSLTILLVSLFSYALDRSMGLLGLYALSMYFSIATVEIVLSKMKPIKGVLYFGSGLLLFLGLLFGSLYGTQKFDLKTYIAEELKAQPNLDKLTAELLNSSDKGAVDLAALLNNPEVFAEQVVKPLPSYIIIGVFLTLFTNLFLVLRSKRLISRGQDKVSSERELMAFRVPEFVIWITIAALALFIFGKDIFGHDLIESISMGILAFVGIFYTFQGFSLFMDALTHFKIFGFFRFFIVMTSLLMASWAFSLVGLFDSFFYFRKYLKKNN